MAGGYAEVTAERCTILSTEALPFSDLDEDIAKKRIEEAEADIKKAETDAERDRSENSLNIARAMLENAQN